MYQICRNMINELKKFINKQFTHSVIICHLIVSDQYLHF